MGVKFVKKIGINLFIFSILVVLIIFSTHSVLAQDPTVDLRPSDQLKTVDASANDVVRFAINGLTVIAIIASLVWLLWGGVKWIISGGDKTKVDSARGTIVAAIVGLIIVILAWVIINAVLQVLTGTTLGTFELPSLGGNKTP